MAARLFSVNAIFLAGSRGSFLIEPWYEIDHHDYDKYYFEKVLEQCKGKDGEPLDKDEVAQLSSQEKLCIFPVKPSSKKPKPFFNFFRPIYIRDIFKERGEQVMFFEEIYQLLRGPSEYELGILKASETQLGTKVLHIMLQLSLCAELAIVYARRQTGFRKLECLPECVLQLLLDHLKSVRVQFPLVDSLSKHAALLDNGLHDHHDSNSLEPESSDSGADSGFGGEQFELAGENLKRELHDFFHKDLRGNAEKYREEWEAKFVSFFDDSIKNEKPIPVKFSEAFPEFAHQYEALTSGVCGVDVRTLDSKIPKFFVKIAEEEWEKTRNLECDPGNVETEYHRLQEQLCITENPLSDQSKALELCQRILVNVENSFTDYESFAVYYLSKILKSPDIPIGSLRQSPQPSDQQFSSAVDFFAAERRLYKLCHAELCGTKSAEQQADLKTSLRGLTSFADFVESLDHSNIHYSEVHQRVASKDTYLWLISLKENLGLKPSLVESSVRKWRKFFRRTPSGG